ncbi:hypothetical protein [Gemmatimonas sp.]|uniref:hypothetical protein n=1 Tax=Gemmatimonas sp. TaxID=1962908 RepID=UPI003567D218
MLLLLIVACGGTTRGAPLESAGARPASARATGSAAPVRGRAHAHVHLPGEVRGVRLYPVFARAIIAPMYLDGRWLVPPDSATSVGAFLASLSPTLVSGLFSFAPEEAPTETHRRVLNTVRQAVRERVPDARFDVYLDALAYPSGPSVVEHMRTITEQLEPDLWLFTRWDRADRENFAVVASASNQAHANGQAIGGTTESLEIPTDSDFGVVLGNVLPRELTRQLTALTAIHALPYLVTVGESGSGMLSALPSGIHAFPHWRLAMHPELPGLTIPQATARFRW